MEEPKPKKASPETTGGGGPGGTRAPVKGDSSASGVPRDTDGATFIEDTSTPPMDPGAAAGEVTFVDASPTPATGKPRLSTIFPKKSQLQPGDVLGGRFEILQVLGEGGMGTVYKAVDREVDHIVALKLIRPELAAHPAILARFKQELLTARQVTHRNVIRIHDLSEVDGVKFITMEFVEGCDLRKLLVEKGKRYRMIFHNQTGDTHPLHLHRHDFEIVKIGGKSTTGIKKDVVNIPRFSDAEVDFVANHPGPSLFHCHMQLHMDFGFMTLVKYS